MHLALATQTWYDFVLYTSKGLVRVFYDKEHWGKLQKTQYDATNSIKMVSPCFR